MSSFQDIISILDNKGLSLISQEVKEQLKAPERIIEINIPLKTDDGFKTFKGWRVQYNNALGPFKGGIRFHPESSLEEFKMLAFLMTVKNAAAGLPFGGAKGGIKCSPEDISRKELENLSRKYVEMIYPLIGPEKDIPAPDVNTNAKIMAWMTDEYGKISGKFEPAVFTGKPVALGGSPAREIATSFGGYVILREFLKSQKKKCKTAAVQGFGNVGMFLSRLLFENGFAVQAVSDSKGGIFKKSGINIKELIKKREKSGRKVSEMAKEMAAEKITNKDLLELNVDVLAPSAIEDQITEENARLIKSKIILETANAAISRGADSILAAKKIAVLPDIIASAGGVVGSYFEWTANHQKIIDSEKEGLKKIDNFLTAAFLKILKKSKEASLSLREAAYLTAVSNIEEAMKLRGKI